MDFATRYNPPVSPRVAARGKSQTRQEFARECDINNIVARAGLGLARPLVAPSPVYADVSDVPTDYGELVARIDDARSRFAGLPANMRDRFGNDPAKLLAFLGDAANKDEAIKLGLIAAPAASAASSDDDSSKVQ